MGPVSNCIRAKLLPDAAQLRAAAIMDSAIPGLLAHLNQKGLPSGAHVSQEQRFQQRPRIQPDLFGSDYDAVAQFLKEKAAENKRLLLRQRVTNAVTVPLAVPETVTPERVAPERVAVANTVTVPDAVTVANTVTVTVAKGMKTNALGLYLFGPVGRGKTMLMNFLFETLKASHPQRVRRMHYCEFMRSISGAEKSAFLEHPSVLFLDELAIGDVQDAALFPRALANFTNTVFVMTSNQHPQGLYANGLNRHVFLPSLLNALKTGCRLVSLEEGQDFRKTVSRPGWTYALDKTTHVEICHHNINIALSATRNIALPRPLVFSVDLLIESELSDSDFVTILDALETDSILELHVPGPFLARDTLVRTRRFCKLVEALYDRPSVSVKFVAPVGPDELFPEIVSSEEMLACGLLGETAGAAASPLAAAAVDEGRRSVMRVVSRLRQAVPTSILVS